MQDEKSKGTKLILWSCRCGDSLQDALNACDEWGLQFDAVNENITDRIIKYGYSESRKVSADQYWDDNAVVKK